MKARKLPSGSWNIRVFSGTEGGKRQYVSFTADTKAEVEYKAANFKRNKKPAKHELTVRDCIERYIALSENLSPSTLHAYDKIRLYAFKDIMDKKVSVLTDTDMQEAINRESKRMAERTSRPLSPKTVKNEWGLVSAAIKAVCGVQYNIRLPKVQRPVEILPPPEAVLRAIYGTDIELPCLLALWCGLRMSEIRALRQESVQGNYLVVTGAKLDIGQQAVDVCYTKTQASQRIVRIPRYVRGLLPDTEYLVPMTRGQIYGRFKALMEKEGIDMSFHDLRHMYASISLNMLNIPAKVVQVSGGWSTAAVMERIYSQSFDQAQANADDARDAYFEECIMNMHHKA